MIDVGSTVFYGVEGVCKVKGITNKSLEGKTRSYYVLEPAYRRASVIFIPTDNRQLTARLRPIVSSDEAMRLLDGIPQKPFEWIDSENKRREVFRSIVLNGGCLDLLRLASTLHIRRDSQERTGKKLCASDSRFLKTIEKMINDELASSLGLAPDEVPDLIQSRMRSKIPSSEPENHKYPRQH